MRERRLARPGGPRRPNRPEAPATGQAQPSSAAAGASPPGIAAEDDSLELTQQSLAEATEELRVQAEELEIAQQQLDWEKARYAELFQLAPDAILVTDLRGIIREANVAAEHLFGLPGQFLLSKPISGFVAENRQAFRQRLLGLPRLDRTQHWEVCLKPHLRPVITVSITVAAGKTFQDRHRVLFWSLRDISERKKMEEDIQALNARLEERVAERTAELEEAYRRSEEDRARIRDLNARLTTSSVRLRTILESIPDAVYVVGPDGWVVMANREALRIVGAGSVEEMREPRRASLIVSSLYVASGQPIAPEELPTRRAARGEAFDAMLVEHRDPVTGEVAWLLCSGAPVRGEGGEPAGGVVVAKTVTEMKQLEAERLALLKAKDEFLSIVAHELRTPLTSLKGFSQMMLRSDQGQLGERQKHYLHTMDRQTDRMARLIDNLLDISRIQLDRLDLTPVWLDLAALATDVASQVQATTDRHIIAVEAKGGPVAGRWDRDRVSQVLFNLISNAVHYSPEGGRVRIRVRREGGCATVSVQDQGIGIDLEALPGLFERYVRSADADHARAEGMGLGLYIASSLVQAHGGQIWAESCPGQGSTFYFSLPMEPEGEGA